MTTLSIGRLTATLPESPGEQGLAARAEGMLADATGRRLDELLAAWPLPAGHWFLRRLALQLPLDLHRGGLGTERQWADAIADALHQAVDAGQAVHYGSERDALADVMASAAVGQFGNEWAWQELGLVDAGISGHPRRAVLAALGRHPELALPALSAAVERSGAAAVHRLLGPPGWLELARLVYRAYSGQPPPAWLASPGGAGGHGAAADGAGGSPEQTLPAVSPAPEVAVRIRRLADGELARRFRQARIRPDTTTALAWSVLAAAAGDQGLLMQSAAKPVLMHLAAALLPGGAPPADPGSRAGSPAMAPSPGLGAGPAGPGQGTANGAGRNRTTPNATGAGQLAATAAEPDQVTTGAGSRQAAANAAGHGRAAAGDARNATAAAAPPERRAAAAGPASRGPGGHSAGADDPAPGPDQNNARQGWPSAWAGVLHLYCTAAEAEVPAALLADDVLAARPLAWVLHAVACQLVPAAPGDPALLAFAGLLPTDQPPSQAWRPADQLELDSITGHARRWLAVTARRMLHDRAATAETVERLLHRQGIVFAERGWIDVEMPMSKVDIDIRRAGLDIDPGWIGWLGSVVKFRYA
jgi:hypothetical protein